MVLIAKKKSTPPIFISGDRVWHDDTYGTEATMPNVGTKLRHVGEDLYKIGFLCEIIGSTYKIS
jgi:hypothetical protein